MDLNIDWLLSLPRPIIVGAKVAEYLKEHFPDLEIIDYKFDHNFGRNGIVIHEDYEGDNLIFSSIYKSTDILKDLERGAEIVKNNR